MLHLLVLLGATLSLVPGVTPTRIATGSTISMEYALLESPERRVRAFTPWLDGLVAKGLRRSPTFGGLLASLEQTDVIVQIVEDVNLPLRTPARIVLVPNPREYRFLRIQVRPEGTDDEVIATLGHELRHALEIAAAPEVRSDAAIAALLRRIGYAGPSLHEWDTDDAHRVGRDVRRELRDRRVDQRRAEQPSLR